MHADWVILGGLDASMQPGVFLLPIEDVHVEDTWRMGAMAGTGSNDIVVERTFVPDHRMEPAIDFAAGSTAGAAIHSGTLYQMPILPFLHCETIGVYTGGLRGAVDAFDATVKTRVRGHTLARVRDQQLTHLQLGEAHVQAEVAQELARGHIRLVTDCLESDVLRVGYGARAVRTDPTRPRSEPPDAVARGSSSRSARASEMRRPGRHPVEELGLRSQCRSENLGDPRNGRRSCGREPALEVSVFRAHLVGREAASR